MSGYHTPVLLKDSIDGLNISPGGIYVDVTYGGGGHSAEILRRLKDGRLYAFDQDEDAAADSGVNPLLYKLKAHAVAAFLTGVAGGLFARYAAFIHPNGVFGFNISVQILLMPVIGGLGTVWGPVIGGVVIGIIEEEIVAYFPQAHLLIYGGLLIVIVLFEPGRVRDDLALRARWKSTNGTYVNGERVSRKSARNLCEPAWAARMPYVAERMNWQRTIPFTV